MKFKFKETVRAEVRRISKPEAMRVLTGIARYAETGNGDVIALHGEYSGMYRLRIGDYRVFFTRTGAGEIEIQRIAHRSEAY